MDKAQLAKRAGVSASEITRVENGERTPGDGLKCVIASALNMPVERLFPMPTVERINEMFLADSVAAAS